MRNQGVKGLLVAAVVLLLLNLAAQFSTSSAKEQIVGQSRVVGIATATVGNTIFLFRTFEEGRTDVTSTQTDVDETNRSGPLVLQPASRWSPLKMKDAESKPK